MCIRKRLLSYVYNLHELNNIIINAQQKRTFSANVHTYRGIIGRQALDKPQIPTYIHTVNE